MYTVAQHGLAQEPAQPPAAAAAAARLPAWEAGLAAVGGIAMLLALGSTGFWLWAKEKAGQREREGYRLAWEREAAQRWAT